VFAKILSTFFLTLRKVGSHAFHRGKLHPPYES
jgi:hypothetical protein